MGSDNPNPSYVACQVVVIPNTSKPTDQQATVTLPRYGAKYLCLLCRSLHQCPSLSFLNRILSSAAKTVSRVGCACCYWNCPSAPPAQQDSTSIFQDSLALSNTNIPEKGLGLVVCKNRGPISQSTSLERCGRS